MVHHPQNICGKCNSFEFSYQCTVGEYIQDVIGRETSPLGFKRSESHTRGNSFCLRCLQEGRYDDIYCPNKISKGHCPGKGRTSGGSLFWEEMINNCHKTMLPLFCCI